MKKIYLAFMAVATLVLASCGPTTNPNALTEKVNPSTEDFTRTVLIEQYTGQDCGYCPSGAKVIQQMMEKYPGKVIWTAHHFGFAIDEFTIDASKSIGSTFGVNTAPSMSLNREKQKYHDFSVNEMTGEVTVYPNETEAMIFHPAYLQEENGVSTMLKDAIDKEGMASVHIKKEMVDGKLKIGVYGAVKGETKARLNVLIQEDGLVARQNDYTLAAMENPSYVHNNVPRVFLSVPLGDEIILDGGTYQKEYELTPNATWKLQNCEIVAFVTKSNFKTVLNAASVPVQ